MSQPENAITEDRSADIVDIPDIPIDEDLLPRAQSDFDISGGLFARAKYDCEEDGRHCDGKKLSSRDAHNCKVKSKGKYYSCDRKKECVAIKQAVKDGLYNGGCYS